MMPEKADPRKGKGYWGRIAFVDLSERTIEYEHLDDSFHEHYLGGMGLGSKILWDRMEAGTDPLGPDNILGFTTGVLTDTGALFSGRFTVVGKSPTTGGWGDANCGGYFAPVLKRCGLDALFISGVGDKPVYLHIDENGAEIGDASDLWGVDTVETENILKERHGKKSQVAAIGPAGENRSLLAGICNDGGRIAARSGLGAVMGSKNLKAVVVAGTRRVGVHDKERITVLRKEFLARLEKGQGMNRFLGDRLFGLIGWLTRKGPLHPRQPADLYRMLLRKFGTSGLTALCAESGDSPIKNWGGVGFRDFPLKYSQNIGAEAVNKYEVKKYGCYSCPIKCGGIMRVTDGPHVIKEMHKPEYETLCAFGSLLLNDDLNSIFYINDMINRAGIDSIGCGGVLAFAVECFENGILNIHDTDGLQLTWGNAEAIIELTRMIINREGIGDVLADGVKAAAARIGKAADRFAVHCGGVEAPMHDPKIDPGFGMVYMCDPTPARHTIASLQYLDLQHLEDHFKSAVKRSGVSTHKQVHTYHDKGGAIAIDTFYKMLVDCAGVCLFGTQVGGRLPLCEWLNAATGWNLSNEDYLIIGERIQQVRHSFNVREGINEFFDFRPHPRIIGDPPQETGPSKNVTLDIDTLGMSYYEAMGWDLDSGLPRRGCLERLGLHDIIDVLYRKKHREEES